MKQQTYFLFVTLFFTSATLLGQAHSAPHNSDHEFKKFRIALNLGHAYIPGASFGIETNYVAIPVWGLDLQYWHNPKWGFALKNDFEIAKYTVDNNSSHSNELLRKNPLIVSLPILFSPWENELTFLMGPGIELEGTQNFSILRLGLAYEFEIEKHWDFAPEIIYDLKNGHINSLTVAIGVGKRF